MDDLRNDCTSLRKEEAERPGTESSAAAGSLHIGDNVGNFARSAPAIFDVCKALVGATAGYVALLSRSGKENEIQYLDTGECVCTVDPTLPMPIRGLRKEVYRTGKPIFDNSFEGGEWSRLLPPGHATLHNVLFAPLMLDGRAQGLIGLANKPGGFTDDDVRLVSAFAGYAVLALRTSRMLEVLERREEHFRSVVQTATDAILSADRNGNIVFWNPSAERLFGYSAEEVTGQPLTCLMPQRLQQRHLAGVTRIVSGGSPNILGRTVEEIGITKDGSEFPLELSLSKWSSGGDLFFTAIVRDISARKQSEGERERLLAQVKEEKERAELLARSLEHQFDLIRTVMENTRACLAYLDADFNFVSVNESYARSSGHSREDLIGHRHFDLFPNAENQAIFEKVRDTGEAVEFREKPFEYVDQPWRGTTYWDWTLVPVGTNIGVRHGLVLSLVDVTERVRSERNLRESEERFRLTFDQSPIGAAIMSPDYRIQRVNKALSRFLGYSQDELLQFGPADITHLDDLQADMEGLKELAAGRIDDFQMEKRYTRKDGEVVWGRLHRSALRDETGCLRYFISVVEDITEAKRAQLERESLYEAERTARAAAEDAIRTRDEFLSVASHELKTPLTALLGYSQLLSKQIDSGEMDLPRFRKVLGIVSDQSFKLAKLVNRLLDISRVEAGKLVLEKVPTDIPLLVREVIADAQHRAEGRKMLCHAAGRFEAVVDPLRLEQVLSNLIDNAVKHTPEHTPIDISVSKPDKKSFRIAVRDWGRGIPTEHREAIFDRFYQAHERVPGGMGLGLYISKQIVELHCGKIEVESPEDGGTRFLVTLPL